MAREGPKGKGGGCGRKVPPHYKTQDAAKIKRGWGPAPAYSPWNSGLRRSMKALIASPKSFECKNAEFQAAT